MYSHILVFSPRSKSIFYQEEESPTKSVLPKVGNGINTLSKPKISERIIPKVQVSPASKVVPPRPIFESRNTDNTLTVPDKKSKKSQKSESTQMGKTYYA